MRWRMLLGHSCRNTFVMSDDLAGRRCVPPYVRCFFFSAAGNSTLFRIRR